MGERRRIAAWATALVVAVVAALAVTATTRAPRVAASPRTFEGPGRELAENACLACHSAMLVTQQHKDSTGWEKSVRQMESWGAAVPDSAHHRELIRYLVARYGPVSAAAK